MFMTIYISHLSRNIYFCPASLQLLAAYHFSSFTEHVCVSARFRISSYAKTHTHTQWPTKIHVQMCLEVYVGEDVYRNCDFVCVCVSEKGAGPAACVCLSLVCVTQDTDRRLRLVDARVPRS